MDLFGHATGLFLIAFVIISQQVQDPMHKQNIDDRRQGAVVVPTHFESGRGGDHNIPEKFWQDIPEFAFKQGKGKHIGGGAYLPILQVEACHLLVIHDDDAQLTISESQAV